MTQNSRTWWVAWVLAAGFLFVTTAPVSAGDTHNANPLSYGRTFGAWEGLWWNWALQFPSGSNPLLAPDGPVDCQAGNSGSVWFLAGNFGDTSVRTCSIAKGKAIFFPILNTLFWAPEDAATEAALRALAKGNADLMVNLSCTLDGIPCEYSNLIVRTQSPAFVLSIPAGSLLTDFGVTAGDRFPAVSDGHWVMLPPPTPGAHVLQFSGMIDGFFTLDVTYNLTVE